MERSDRAPCRLGLLQQPWHPPPSPGAVRDDAGEGAAAALRRPLRRLSEPDHSIPAPPTPPHVP